MGALVQTFSNMFPPQFGEKTFWWAHEENTWASPIFFTPPSNQTSTKNIFLPFFSPFFIFLFFIFFLFSLFHLQPNEPLVQEEEIVLVL